MERMIWESLHIRTEVIDVSPQCDDFVTLVLNVPNVTEATFHFFHHQNPYDCTERVMNWLISDLPKVKEQQL